MTKAKHPIAESRTDWQPIDTAPSTGEKILTGFMGQFEW
jgi:hypothetical protein